MDIAVKRGFAIGFVVVAAVAAFYGCQPQLRQSKEALRDALPAELVSPTKPAPTPDAPKPDLPAVPQAAAPAPQQPPQVLEKPAGSSPSVGDVAAAQNAAPPAVDGSKPVAPTPQPPAVVPPGADADAAKGGAFDIVRVEPSGEMVVAGRCAANCSAELLANGKPHDTAKADAQGQWAMTPAPLPPGDYQIGLRTRGPDGKEETSQQTLTVAIPTPPSKDVVVVLNSPDAPSKILQKPEPKVAAAASAIPDAGAPAARTQAAALKTTPEQRAAARLPGGVLAIGAIEAENGRVYAQGTGPTDGRLRLYLNNAPLAAAIVGPDGRWSLRVERGLAPGAYVVRADQFNPATSQVIARVEANFSYAPQAAAAEPAVRPAAPVAKPAEPQASLSAAPPAASAASSPQAESPAPGAMTPSADVAQPVTPPSVSPDPANPVVASIDTAQVRRGDSLWRISRATYGRGMRYTVIYEANDGQIRNPNLIYPGQVLVLPSDEAQAPMRPARP